jgi:phosphoglycerol transferase MdoB-like AlkP superfamily enzyme
VWVLNTVPIAAGTVIQKGIELTSSMHVLHGLVPIAVSLSILLVCPVQNWRHKLLLIVLGVLTAVLILLTTVPILLVALLEMPFQEQAMVANVHHQSTCVLQDGWSFTYGFDLRVFFVLGCNGLFGGCGHLICRK